MSTEGEIQEVASLESNALYRNAPATQYCDVVMKGGVASGIVYPWAICELARTYRFKSIGGTSAGAMAAAATAAAELYRRNTRGADDSPKHGFARIATLPDELGTDERVLSLFQPQRETKPFFDIFTAMLSMKP